MNLLEDDIKKLYRNFLIPSMGGAVATSIYGFVDTIAVGQAIGPAGASATAVILPLFGATSFLGMLCGMGGSVLMSKAKGAGQEEKGNAYFTASLLLMGLLTILFLAILIIFPKEIFTAFGAEESIMPLVMDYAKWVILACPFFLFSLYLACIVRNDGAPELVMKAVIAGGIFNIFGDWLFVFPMDMGMGGASLATAIGNVIQTLIMCSHFFSKRCTLQLVRPHRMFRAIQKITIAGFSAGMLDIAFMVLTSLFNNQIIRYGGTAELAVFGVVITISALFQHLFGGIGQAVQPIVSSNFGADNHKRITLAFRLSIKTTLLCSTLFTLAGILFPIQIIQLFMSDTAGIITQATVILRISFLAFLFMGVNIYSTFFLQAVMKTKTATVIALLRGLVISSVLLYVLPSFMGVDGIWWTVVITELLVLALTVFVLAKRLHHREQYPN